MYRRREKKLEEGKGKAGGREPPSLKTSLLDLKRKPIPELRGKKSTKKKLKGKEEGTFRQKTTPLRERKSASPKEKKSRIGS